MSAFSLDEEMATWAKIEEECTCPGCGRCVLAGPPCCKVSAQRAKDFVLRERGQHPEQIAAKHAAKRERRIARRKARREGTLT